MKQTGELELRLPSGFLCYALQFRFHAFFMSGHDACLLTTPLHLWRPSLQRHYPPSSVLRRHPTPDDASTRLALLSLVGLDPFLSGRHQVSQVAVCSSCPTCHALRPRRRQEALAMRPSRWWLPRCQPCRPSRVYSLSRLNHFSFRLRPAGLITLRLSLGIAPAGPGLSTRWLACLPGRGSLPLEHHDLAWPHSSFRPAKIWHLSGPRQPEWQERCSLSSHI